MKTIWNFQRGRDNDMELDILITCEFDQVVKMLGEIRCLSSMTSAVLAGLTGFHFSAVAIIFERCLLQSYFITLLLK